MKVVYVVAGSQDEFLRWVGKQAPNEDDPELVQYRPYRSSDDVRGRKRPEYLFLKGWRNRPESEWRPIYNRYLANGKRWWEK